VINPFDEYINMIRECQEHSPKEYHKRLIKLGMLLEKGMLKTPSRMSGA